jgi:hypothetical protein
MRHLFVAETPPERPPFPEMEHPAPSTPGGDPLVAGASTGEVGGSRFYSGLGLGQLVAWKCPACGQENSGKLDAGCSHCGSGSVRPQHVGLPPMRRLGKEPDRIGVGVWEREISRATGDVIGTPPPVSIDLAAPSTSIDAAFVEWLKPQQGEFSPRIEQVLYEAWKAAIEWYHSTQRTQPRVELSPEPVVDEDPDRVKVPRVLVRRVIATLEATFDLPDEQQSTELLAMIAELREILE